MILKVKFFGVSWMISSMGKITDHKKKTGESSWMINMMRILG